jgi:multidrug resistance efflux pump
VAKRIIPIVLVALALLGLLVWSQRRPPVEKVSGVIEADEIRLGSRIGGRVKEVLVEEGARVERNQPLVRLEEYDLRELLAQARALTGQRQAEYDRLSKGFREEEIAQAKANFDRAEATVARMERPPLEEEVKAAQAQVRLTSAQLERVQQTQRRLLQIRASGSGAVSQDEIDRAAEDVKVALAAAEVRQQELAILIRGTREEERREARAQRDQALAAWNLAKNGYRQEEVEEAQAALEAAKAAEAALQKQFDELTIHASVTGIVEALELQPGDLVAPNAPVLSLLDAGRMWVRAYVPQGRLDIHPGQKLRVTIDAYPGRDFQGEVTFVSRQEEFTPSNVQTYDERAKQTYRIKVTLNQAADSKIELHPGMTGDVWLPKE